MHNGSLPRKPRKRKTKLIQNSVIQILENMVNAIPIDELKSRMLFFDQPRVIVSSWNYIAKRKDAEIFTFYWYFARENEMKIYELYAI